MVKEFSLQEFEGELVATMEEPEGRPLPETQFRLVLLGDWSGRANRGLAASSKELAEWRPILIDRDNLDQVMAKLGPKLHLPLAADGEMSLTIGFRDLDDFSPDRIYERLDLFDKLRQLRARLHNPSTFGEAADEVRTWANMKPSPEEPTSPESGSQSEPPQETNVSPEGLLDQILDQSPSPAASTPTTNLSAEIGALVRKAVAPYLVQGPDAQEDVLVGAVDQAISGELASILHNPDFQTLEAAWRAANLLVSRLDTGTELKIYLLDISRPEFEADLTTGNDPRQTALYKLLVEKTVGTAGGVPWALVAANYEFDFTRADAELLNRMGVIAKAARAPFVAGASSRLIGCESLADTHPDDWHIQDSEACLAWESIKENPTARYLGLSLPRFLLRLPYGRETEPVDSFDFEEQPANVEPQHNRYLWGNPAFAVAYLLAEAFTRSGWDFVPGDAQEIDGLPLHVYKVEGESVTKPCAEVLMTLRGAEKIIDQGLMPLISMKDSDVVRLGMFQSLAKTPFGVR